MKTVILIKSYDCNFVAFFWGNLNKTDPLKYHPHDEAQCDYTAGIGVNTKGCTK